MAETDIIFGRRPVKEALEAHMPIRSINVAQTGNGRGIDEISKLAESMGIPVEAVPRKKIAEICGAEEAVHQGVVAKCVPFRYTPLEEAIEIASARQRNEGNALVVVCDHVKDSGNLGAIVRSAESSGASAVVIASRRAASVTPSTYKTSAGAVSHVPISMVPNIARALDALKEAGFWAIGASEHSEELLWDADLKGAIALVMGSEHDGISRLVLEKCDILSKLPQQGHVSSLNVAQASTVFMYEWVRQNAS